VGFLTSYRRWLLVAVIILKTNQGLSQMAESTKQQRQAEKTEGNLDPAKKGTERAAAEAGTEVEGRSVLIFISCPHCGSNRVISLDFEGEWFTCGQCQGTYQVVP
jgi:hypothetical protein